MAPANYSEPRDYSDQAWKERAACKGLTDLFFSVDRADKAEAKKVCSTCPVNAECREFALSDKEGNMLPSEAGIWAGTDFKERKALRKARRGTSAIRHGLVAFQKNLCDCEICKGAADSYDRKFRKKLWGVIPPHDVGTMSLYTNRGCRCKLCIAVVLEYQATHQRKLRDRG